LLLYINMNNLNTDDWKLFDEIIIKPVMKESKCCSLAEFIHIEKIPTCINCGFVDFAHQLYVHNPYDGNFMLKIIQPYKRIVYFRQKLNLICCKIYYPIIPKILFFINKNKNKKFKNLKKLKTVMKHAKLNKYYKYIYSIYFEISGRQLIKMDYRQYEQLIYFFIKMERIFLKQNIKKNLYSYNVIIYFLLKMIGHPDFKFIILPLNRNRIKKKISELYHLILKNDS
jgi:hypothetical protein